MARALLKRLLLCSSLAASSPIWLAGCSAFDFETPELAQQAGSAGAHSNGGGGAGQGGEMAEGGASAHAGNGGKGER
ncbi:MAG: hypothetical protein ACOY0T_33940 [Myxococcota bacterium]